MRRHVSNKNAKKRNSLVSRKSLMLHTINLRHQTERPATTEFIRCTAPDKKKSFEQLREWSLIKNSFWEEPQKFFYFVWIRGKRRSGKNWHFEYHFNGASSSNRGGSEREGQAFGFMMNRLFSFEEFSFVVTRACSRVSRCTRVTTRWVAVNWRSRKCIASEIAAIWISLRSAAIIAAPRLMPELFLWGEHNNLLFIVRLMFRWNSTLNPLIADGEICIIIPFVCKFPLRFICTKRQKNFMPLSSLHSSHHHRSSRESFCQKRNVARRLNDCRKMCLQFQLSPVANSLISRAIGFVPIAILSYAE